MAHKLMRLKESLYSTPHLITPQGFSFVEEYLNKRNLGDFEDDEDVEDNPKKKMSVNGVGFINISGPLTYRPVVTLCGGGGTNYQGIISQAEDLVSEGVKTIVLNIDSGGGEAFGVFSAASKVRKLADENGIRILSYVDGTAASAAYVWASISDEIIAHEDSRLGSIGVVIALCNNAEQLKKEGITRKFVYSGENKIPFDESGDFREEFIADLQASVDKLYGKFTKFVDTNRKLEVGSSEKTQAKVYDVEEAAQLGLLDYVMTEDEFIEYLNETNGAGMIDKLMNSLNKGSEMSQLNEVMSQLSEAQEMLQTKEGVIAALNTQLAELTDKVVSLEAQAQAIKAEAEMAAVQSRKDALAAVMGVDNPELNANFEVVKSLDQAAFDLVVKSMKAAADAKAEGAMFKEAGVSGEANAPVAGESKEMAILKAQFQVK